MKNKAGISDFLPPKSSFRMFRRPPAAKPGLPGAGISHPARRALSRLFSWIENMQKRPPDGVLLMH